MRSSVTIADLDQAWPEDLKALVTKAFSQGSRVGALKATAAIAALPESLQGAPFVLGFCSTFTLQPLSEFIHFGLATLPVRPKLIHADLDNIEQSLLDPDSPVHAAKPNALLVIWRLEELAPTLAERPWGMSAAERKATVRGVVERIESLVESYAKSFVTPLFLSSLPSATVLGRRFADAHSETGLAVARQEINAELLRLTNRHRICHIFDFSAWVEREGESVWDRRMDAFARQPIAVSAVPSFSAYVRRAMAPLVRPARKVLALDLDNTLWGGILGEGGIAGLQIGQDFPGKIYRRIQLAALALKDQGVLLALLSKNNHPDVVEAFEALPHMPLKLDDFAAVRVNWEPKSANLLDIARQLNLGVDSFVFMDDTAFEREQMLCALPEVAVLQNSEDPLSILDTLLECPYFDAYRVTEEDRLRSNDYANQQDREELRESSGTIESFLRSLELKVEIRQVDAAGIGRAVQMLAKTNQFNLTTRRHGEADVLRYVADPKNLVLALSLRDRFGDQGVIGLAIMIGGDGESAEVDSFLLSCRALGRGVEDALWASLVKRAGARGYIDLRASYLPSGKNVQCRALFERLGMTRIEEKHGEGAGSDGDRAQHYRLKLPYVPSTPDWLSVTEY
ncbi:MAG: HAD-IIIC family phosphatase [Rhodocyclales bacterium]|nr:HAD-IIIC family phosphatase [Rhodocyclales bacterium]